MLHVLLHRAIRVGGGELNSATGLLRCLGDCSHRLLRLLACEFCPMLSSCVNLSCIVLPSVLAVLANSKRGLSKFHLRVLWLGSIKVYSDLLSDVMFWKETEMRAAKGEGLFSLEVCPLGSSSEKVSQMVNIGCLMTLHTICSATSYRRGCVWHLWWCSPHR
jgi:hypothetical protein